MDERLARETHDSLPGIPEPAEQAAPVCGHAGTISFLANAYRSNEMPHAILLAGPKGIGKATLAFQFVRHLFLNPDPANAPDRFSAADVSSAVFRQVATGAHPGLLHLTRPFDDKTKKFKTAITVDEIRSIGQFVGLTAHDGGYRAVIVDSADDMNRNAANALLKNLEEPPARTVFVLVSHVPGRLLPTIRSRCQTVRLQPLNQADIASVLEKMPDGGISGETRHSAISASEGSVRDAIILSQFGGLEIKQAVSGVICAPSFDAGEAHKIAGAVGARGQDLQFDLFNSAVMSLLAECARNDAAAGKSRTAAEWSGTWQQVNTTIGEVAAFNLDRKQHVVGLLAELHHLARSQGWDGNRGATGLSSGS